MRRADDARQEAEMSDARIGAHGIKSNLGGGRAGLRARSGGGGRRRRIPPREEGWAEGRVESERGAESVKGQRVPASRLFCFSFVLPSLFCFAFPLAKREKRDKAEYQSCGVVWFVASTQWIVSRRVDNL